MKKAFIAATVSLFMAAFASAAPFAPTLLKLSAPEQIQYEFDNSVLSIPVKVVGKPATAVFCVYTNGMAGSIAAVQNGYLGWHYVNKVDTSIYISQPVQLEIGSNNIQWDGKDDDGKMVSAGTYTYYVWGMDTYSSKVPASLSIVPRAAAGGKVAHIQEKGTDGMPLANPVWYGKGCKQKWVIGNDPADSALIETTDFTLASGFSIANTLALQPDDFNNFFIRIANSTSQVQAVQKLAWVPNGFSVPETSWADNSMVTWGGPGYGSIHPGPEIVGDYLWTGTNYYLDTTTAQAPVIAIDWRDGTIVKEYDLSRWWSSTQDKEAGALLNGGPNGVIERNGFLFLNAHSSCQKMMVNPAAESDEDFVVWANGNGDYVLDHNFDENAVHKWACHDLTVGPSPTISLPTPTCSPSLRRMTWARCPSGSWLPTATALAISPSRTRPRVGSGSTSSWIPVRALTASTPTTSPPRPWRSVLKPFRACSSSAMTPSRAPSAPRWA
jgi:hypothetical protein